MIRKTLAIVCILTVSLIARGEDQNWTENSLTFKLNNNQSIRFVSEVKYRSWDWADGVFVKNWVVGYDRKLENGFSVGTHYKQELTRKIDGPDVIERRIGLDAGWGTRFDNGMRFDIRTRLEIRNFDEDRSDDHLRFRFRFRLRDNWQIARLKLEPYVSLEPFYDTQSDSFSRYRFSVGTMIPLGTHAKLRVAYLLQNKRSKQGEHVFNTGISVVF